MRQPHASKSASLWNGGEHEQHTGRQQVAQRHTGLRPRGPEAATAVVAVLGGHQHRTAPLAADGEALQQPADEQQDRRRDADGGVRREQADREGRDTHQHQRDDEHLLAADAVTEVAEDDATERPGDEADRVGAEGQQGRVDRVGVREEQRAEDERCGRAVEEEVVPLHGGADQAGEDDLDDAVATPVGGVGSLRGRRFAIVWTCACSHLAVSLVMRRSSRRPSGMSCR